MSFFRASNTGTILLGPGDTYTILASSAETDGDYIVLEALVPPDGGPPPHIHHNQVETFYILEGEMEVMVGDQIHETKAGDFVHISKGTPHRFLNQSRTMTKMIFTLCRQETSRNSLESPSNETTDRNAPPEPLTDAFIQRMLEAAERHDIELLPPPEGTA